MSNETATEREPPPAWHLEEWDGPSEEKSATLGGFLVGQHSGPTLTEKLRFPSWKLRENEAAPGFASVMVNDLGEVVSSCTVTPKRLWLGDRETRWGEIGDTFTDDRYQRKGMFSALVNASRSRAQAAGFEIVYGLPNDQSLPGYLAKLNFAIKDDLQVLGYSLPLSSAPVWARLSKRAPWADGLLGNPLFTATSRTLARGLGKLALSPGMAVEATRVVGVEFDELWSRARVGLPRAQVRDARYLRWRVLANPFDINLLALRENGVLVGYLSLLIRQPTEATPLRHAMVLDWLYSPSDGMSVGRAIAEAAVGAALGAHADLVTIYTSANSPIPIPFPRQQWFRRGQLRPVIIHKNIAGQALLEDRAPWHFTLSDTDAF